MTGKVLVQVATLASCAEGNSISNLKSRIITHKVDEQSSIFEECAARGHRDRDMLRA